MVSKIIKFIEFSQQNKFIEFWLTDSVQADALRTPFQKCLEGRIFFQHNAFSYKQVPRFLQLQRQYHRYDNNLCAAQMMSLLSSANNEVVEAKVEKLFIITTKKFAMKV
ncbi:hypothetical protein BpHYR1_002108 [Brachionus plicatilis]|uniref:Uncharacterized protein n=1 Tax=Brachionus plicatilis TaxID=10195 RepID=A0A3M7T8Q1_BRAPC|nr:hypothetical protein BpHYR1_002108 [Brachionus plicatilis]